MSEGLSFPNPSLLSSELCDSTGVLGDSDEASGGLKGALMAPGARFTAISAVVLLRTRSQTRFTSGSGLFGRVFFGWLVTLDSLFWKKQKSKVRECVLDCLSKRKETASSRKAQPCAEPRFGTHVLCYPLNVSSPWGIKYLRVSIWALTGFIASETQTGGKSMRTPECHPGWDCCLWCNKLCPLHLPCFSSCSCRPVTQGQVAAPAAVGFPHKDSKPQQLKSELLKKSLAGNTHRWPNRLIYQLVTEIEAKQTGEK